MDNKKIVLGISGGVDSTTAALKLKNEGFHVIGVALKMSDATDISEAEKAANEVEIEFDTVDMRGDFEKSVVRPFIDFYSHGKTPNPCIFCNPAVKFAALCRYAKEHGIHEIATGHYCKVDHDEDTGRYYIKLADDRKKDQSYMLWGLGQDVLSMLHFPLAESAKSDVRKIASENGFSSANTPDSQEICFIPDGDYAGFIENRTGKFPHGDFISPEGVPCGKHKGIIHYTIGQRKHLGIALGRPVFVSEINTENNTVILSDAGGEFFSSMTVSGIHFQRYRSDILFENGEFTTDKVLVKVRYAAQPVPCSITLRHTAGGDIADVGFPSPVRAVTPGQSAVFYDGDGALLFGGFIENGVLCAKK